MNNSDPVQEPDTASKSNIDKKIYNYYNDRFNRNFEVNRKLNKEIMTKNRMIMVNTNTGDDKDLSINALFYLTYILFFMCVLYVGFKMDFYSVNTMIYMMAFIILLYIYLFITRYYWTKFKKGLYRAEQAGINIVKTAVGFLFPKYGPGKCPTGCHPKGSPQIPDDNTFETSGADTRYLSLDDPTNVWRRGQNYQAIEGGYNWYGENPNAKQNHCVAQDGQTDPAEFLSAIPCKYYIGYVDKSRE